MDSDYDVDAEYDADQDEDCDCYESDYDSDYDSGDLSTDGDLSDTVTTGLYVDDPSTGWSSYGSLGSTGALLDQTQNLVDSIGPVPSSSSYVDPYSLPVSGDAAGLMSQINGQLGQARQMYEDTVADVGTQPSVSPAVQDTLDQIQSTYRATPEQLDHMNGMLSADIARQEVSNSIAEHDAYVSTSNDSHQAILDAIDATDGA